MHSEDRQYNNDEPTGNVIDNAGELREQESKEGIKTAGNTRQYHHIEEVTEAWHRRLDRDNVIGLSEANHRRIHKEYDRGYMAKKKMQRTLYDMLQRFRCEFGDGGGI